MKKIWEVRHTEIDSGKPLAQALGCHCVTAALLNNRAIYSVADADRFLNPSFKNLRSPFCLKGVDKAVSRIVSALKNKEKILIFGDYDVDGITATFLVYRFLQTAGADIGYYIPHRVKEGYGLRSAHIDPYAVSKRINLVITVDCGSTSHDAVLEAEKHGIDIIITDHHEPPDELPPALAVINPKRKDCSSDLQDLAGVGVAFYLIICLRKRLREIGFWRGRQEPNLKTLCDLVALGTIADMVPLVGDNRILTRAGLDVLQSGGNSGIQALMKRCGIGKQHINSGEIAFQLAPRLNAAGRIEHADTAMALLAADSAGQADPLAERLHQLNRKRQEVEKEILEDIDVYLNHHPKHAKGKVIVLSSPDWHVGILGIVASRLVNRYARPVVILALEGEVAKGSARSVPGIDLSRLLSACSENLITYGGHAMAAGLQISAEQIDPFRKKLEQAVIEIVGQTRFRPKLLIDCELRFEDVSHALIDELDMLKPFGEENPEPVFTASEVRVLFSKTTAGGHRRMSLAQASGRNRQTLQAIHFNPDPETVAKDHFKKIAYRIQWNRWNGNKTIQVIIEDIFI